LECEYKELERLERRRAQLEDEIAKLEKELGTY